MVSTKNGWGRTEGDVTVREPGRRGKTKFRGEFVGVVEPDGGVEGFVIGDTKGKKSFRLFANFNVNQDPYSPEITGEFGTDSQETGSVCAFRGPGSRRS